MASGAATAGHQQPQQQPPSPDQEPRQVCGAGGEFKLNMADASLDTSASTVDTPIQDSGSNQSGSDSGLGHTNSLSSDNSTFNTTVAAAAAIGQDQAPAAALVVAAVASSGNAGKATASAAAVAAAKSENNHIIAKNKGLAGQQHIVNNSGSSSTTSKSAGSGLGSVYPDSKSGLNLAHETRTTTTGHADGILNRYKPGAKENEQHQQTDSEKRKSGALAPNRLDEPSSSSPSSNNAPTTGTSASAPLKSLLKRPSNLNVDHNTRPTSRGAGNEHKRRVTFNQTVIVFCEEIGAPVLSGGGEEAKFGLPPSDYQDPLCSFEPPEDYCDRENVPDRKLAVGKPAIVNNSFNEQEEEEDADEEEEEGDFKHPLIDASASNFTDDQLIGLLENESLLDLESFKITCDDELFEEDYQPTIQNAVGGKLNIDSNCLGNEAISDEDTDSESSLYNEERKETAPLTFPRIHNSTHNLANNNNFGVKVEPPPASLKQPKALEPKPVVVLESQDSKSDRLSANPLNPTKSSSQKTAPARVKVSTVDNCCSKRNSSRREEADLKFKQETKSHHHDLHGRPEKQKESFNSNNKNSGSSLSNEPMLIRQSVVEPVKLTKSTVISNTFAQDKKSSSINNKSQIIPPPMFNTPSLPPEAQVRDHHHAHQQLTLDIDKSQKQPSLPSSNHYGPTQKSPDCQICKVMDSRKSRALSENMDDYNSSTTNQPDAQATLRNETSHLINHHHNVLENSLPRTSSGVAPGTATGQQAAAAVYNDSCVSCREASMKSSIIPGGNQSNIPVAGANQQIRPQPLAYQLVYVVDQNGNRVRALSVVKSNSNITGQQPMLGKRILVAQNGIRFPNPSSLGANQLINVASNQSSATIGQPRLIAVNSANNSLQYRVVGTAQPYPMQQHQHQQQLHYVPIQNASNTSKITSAADLGHRMPVDSGLGSLRPHTIYYVRQPLEPQHAIQSRDVSSLRSSFPDPHEIRRLDGIRGPKENLNLSSKRDLIYNEHSLAGLTVAPKDDSDDPTFGFSKRPSVKVVATNSFQPTTHPVKFSDTNQVAFSTNNFTTRHAPSGQTSRPISVVVMGSQTLDRRHLNHYQQHCPTTMKENMSSTSSMSNIHGTYTNYPTNKVSSNTTTTSQQQRISSTNFDPPSAEPTAKESRQMRPDSMRLENNKGVIETGGKVSLPLVAQGRQTSSLTSHQYQQQQQQQRRAQDQSEILYSMNV